MLRTTEAWTDGRHAEDDKNVELDSELAVALANATEGAGSSTVLKVTQVEPSHELGAWQALVACDAQEVQGCEGAEGKAHSVVIESG